MKKFIRKASKSTNFTPHTPIISLTEVASLRSAANGGVYYQYIFFPHFRRCKDKKKNNINQQKLEEILKKRLLRYAQHLTGVYIINIFPTFHAAKTSI